MDSFRLVSKKKKKKKTLTKLPPEILPASILLRVRKKPYQSH